MILDFLYELVLNDKKFSVSSYDDYVKGTTAPQSKTMYDLFVNNGFIPPDAQSKFAFIYFIYRAYELNLVPPDQLEVLDILVYKLTYGQFKLSFEEYISRAEKISVKSGVSIDEINQQYEELVMHVLGLDM